MSSSRAQHLGIKQFRVQRKMSGGGGLTIFSRSYPASLPSAARYPNVQKKKQQQEQQ